MHRGATHVQNQNQNQNLGSHYKAGERDEKKIDSQHPNLQFLPCRAMRKESSAFFISPSLWHFVKYSNLSKPTNRTDLELLNLFFVLG